MRSEEKVIEDLEIEEKRKEDVEGAENVAFAHAPVLVCDNRALRSTRIAIRMKKLSNEAFSFIATGMDFTRVWTNTNSCVQVMVRSAAHLRLVQD